MTFQPPETFNIAHHFLDARVEEGAGDRRALVTDEGKLTYREVAVLASRYGHLLRDAGVRPEERVIVSLPDGADFVGALFGTLKIGAVGVMVNPGLDADAIRYFLDYTRATAAVVGPDAADTFREAAADARHGPRLVEPAEAATRQRLAEAPTELEIFPSHRDDPAIWLLSGGTTARPKAVVQPHTSYANTTELYGKGVLGLGPDDVTISVPKLYFGYALGSNLLFPFSVGASSVLFGERCTPEALFQRIRRHRPTVLVNVPTMINKMLSHPGGEEEDLSCLRLATSAGEALPEELHRRWDEAYGVELLDGLGTAEMWHVFLSNRPGDVKRGTLGKPVPGFEVRLCDDEGREVEDGEVGRLRVRGDSLAHGYWQRREQTRDAFRGEWYVSGDMLRRDADGYYVYCGRADDMVKVSGQWFSPSELENCLLQHPAVREVAVVAAADEEGLTEPHAYVVAGDAGGGPEAGPGLAEELQAFARERLQPYKYPREVVFLEELPRTHLGKVDRGELGGGGT